jgi:hypothetical protein
LKLLVLGVDRGENPQDQTDCYAFVAAALMREFKRILPGDVRLVNVDLASDLNNIQGPADFVLFIGYRNIWRRFSLPDIRQKTGCRKIVSLSDYSFNLDWVQANSKPDWSFCFADHGDPNSTVIYAPCVKKYYVNEPKEKIILMDHGLPGQAGTEMEWTFRISNWLTPLSTRYKILRTARYRDYEKPSWKAHEVDFPIVPFNEYLRLTNHVESFVVTHIETYGFQIMDMVARGIRVVSPVGLLHKSHVERFQIPLFRNGEEMRKILMSPVEPRWNEMVNRCTDYSEVAEMIVSKLKSL